MLIIRKKSDQQYFSQNIIMKIATFCVIFTLASLAMSLPSSFDFRVQPSLIRYADYSFQPEGTIVAHAWGLQLAQILSNSASLILKDRVRLSSQHLIECIKSKNQIWHDATIENIRNATQYISRQGLARVKCIKNRLFEKPTGFCPRYCDDGSDFGFARIKANITKHQNFNSTLIQLTSDQITAGFVIVKVYDSMNYYSSQNPSYLEQVKGENFQYRVGEIVGWKNKGTDIIVRLGLGQGWGYNGFATLNAATHANIIAQMYTLKAIVDQGVRIQKNQLQEQY